MTNDEKAKAYDMALEAARKELGVDRKEWEVVQQVLHNIFPELRESDDERIRKVIYKLMLGMREEIFTSQDEIVTKEKVLAYLEKKPGIKIWPHPIKDAYLEQKEQKPIQSMEDEELVRTIKRLDPNVVVETCTTGTGELDGKALLYTADKSYQIGFRDGFHKGVESVKPVEWSEEDEHNLNSVISLVHSTSDGAWGSCIGDRIENWLKSLRPSWKPSEDEERLINTAISFLKDFADKGYENAVECIDWLKSKLNGNSNK